MYKFPNIGLIKRFLLSCSGVDIETIRRCTSAEVKKYTLIGTCVLIPTILSLFTGGYSIFLISKGNYTLTFILAMVWAWVIFTLDRALVANTKSNKLSLGFLGRCILALFISILISRPIEILIFNDIITQKAGKDLAEKKVEASSRLEGIITIKEKNLSNIDSLEEANYNNYVHEMQYGDKTQGRGRGKGKVATEMEENAKRYTEKTKAERAILQSDIDSLKRERINVEKNVQTNYASGLVGNLALLDAVAEENTTVYWALWLISIFFFILELLPIIIKITSMSGKLDLYNELVLRNEAICLNAYLNTTEEKEEQLTKEQHLQIVQSAQKIDIMIKKETIKELARNHSFFMQTVKSSADEIKRIESEIVKRIKNEAVRELRMAQILKAYNDFSLLLDELYKELLEHHKEANKK